MTSGLIYCKKDLLGLKKKKKKRRILNMMNRMDREENVLHDGLVGAERRKRKSNIECIDIIDRDLYCKMDSRGNRTTIWVNILRKENILVMDRDSNNLETMENNL
jgi:hypothetical protein